MVSLFRSPSVTNVRALAQPWLFRRFLVTFSPSRRHSMYTRFASLTSSTCRNSPRIFPALSSRSASWMLLHHLIRPIPFSFLPGHLKVSFPFRSGHSHNSWHISKEAGQPRHKNHVWSYDLVQSRTGHTWIELSVPMMATRSPELVSATQLTPGEGTSTDINVRPDLVSWIRTRWI